MVSVMTRTSEHSITAADLQKLMAGEGGVDLERIVEGGKQVAMRIVGVRPGTTAARLGAENGDTIETINDMPLSSVSEAYRIAAVVAKEPQIVLKGKRGDEPYVTVLKMSR